MENSDFKSVNIKKSLDFYLENLKKDKRLIQPALNFAQICFENSFYREALVISDAVLEIDANLWHPFFIKAKIYNKKGNREMALKMLEKASSLGIPQKFYAEVSAEYLNALDIQKAAFYILNIDFSLRKAGELIGEKIFNSFKDRNKALSFAIKLAEHIYSWKIFKLFLNTCSDTQAMYVISENSIFNLLLKIKNYEKDRKKNIDLCLKKYTLPEQIYLLMEVLAEENFFDSMEYVYYKSLDFLNSQESINRFMLNFLSMDRGKITRYFYPFYGEMQSSYSIDMNLFWFKMGELSALYGDLERAIKYFNEFLKHPNDNLYLKFYASFFTSDFEKAFFYLKGINGKNIPFEFICFPLSDIKITNKFMSSMLKKLSLVRNLEYKNYVLFYKITFLNQISKIQSDLLKKLEIENSNFWINYGAGILAMNCGEFKMAINYFNSCLAENFNSYKTSKKIVEALFIDGAFNEALSFIKDSKLEQQQKLILEGYLHFLNGDYNTAISIFNKIKNADEIVNVSKAAIFLRGGNYSKAFNILECFNESSFNLEAFLWKCEYYFLKGDLVNLLKTIEIIDKFQSDSFWSLIYKIFAYRKMKKEQELKSLFEEFYIRLSKLNFKGFDKIDINFCEKLLLNKKIGRKEDSYWIIYYLKQI